MELQQPEFGFDTTRRKSEIQVSVPARLINRHAAIDHTVPAFPRQEFHSGSAVRHTAQTDHGMIPAGGDFPFFRNGIPPQQTVFKRAPRRAVKIQQDSGKTAELQTAAAGTFRNCMELSGMRAARSGPFFPRFRMLRQSAPFQ